MFTPIRNTIKSIFYYSLFAIMVGCYSSANAAPKPSPSVSDPGKTIMVSQTAPEFTITLAANPSTGYSWFVADYDPQFITVIKHSYQAPISQLVGARGIDVWNFKVNPAAFTAPHLLKIDMLYARPWNAHDNSNKTEFMVATQ